MVSSPRRVALIIETSNDYARGLLHGIRTYIREHQSWSIHLAEHSRGQALPWLRSWKGDGIIARIENTAIARGVQQAGLPAVDVSAARLAPRLPWVETDDKAIAELAASHLLDRGLKHFAYCGLPSFKWSEHRREHFTRAVTHAGHRCQVLSIRRTGGAAIASGHKQKQIERWVASLPRPCGIMACFDSLALQILQACRSLQIAVPEDIAVIGVDNDELLCDLSDPPLSSVAPDAERTGYTAAALLEDMMAGKPVRPTSHLIPPVGVITRQSTDALALADREVSQAIEYIRHHACRGIRVDDVLASSKLSRRVLERRFKMIIGRTPREEISRVRIQHIRDLLLQTSLPLSDIAARCGIKHTEYLTVLFKRETGLTPSELRQRSLPSSAPRQGH